LFVPSLNIITVSIVGEREGIAIVVCRTFICCFFAAGLSSRVFAATGAGAASVEAAAASSCL
jgi:hypothetical protein